MPDSKAPKVPVTVKMTQEMIDELRDFGTVRSIPNVSPFIEFICEEYMKQHPLSAREREALKILRTNPKKATRD
jgi:hypothetical protein